MDKNKKFFSKIGFILFCYSLLHICTAEIATFVQYAFPEIENHVTLLYVIRLMPTYIIAFPIVYLLFKKFVKKTEFSEHKMKFGHWILAFIMAYGLGMAVNIIVNIIFFFVRVFDQDFMDNNVIVELLSQLNPLLSILIVGIIAPIVEEIVFRKLLIDRMIVYGEAVAIFFSGIVFGIFHGNFQQCFFAAMIGFCFAFVYAKTRNIKYTIFMHMGINLYSCIYMALFQMLMKSGLMTEEGMKMMEQVDHQEYIMDMYSTAIIPLMLLMVMLVVSLGLSIAGVVLFFVFLKKFKFSKQVQIMLEKGTVAKTIILNPGMICFGLLWTVIFIINTFF